MVISLVFILRKMSDNVPDFDQVVDCLLAFCNEDPSTYELVDELNDADSALFKSACNNVEASRELFAAQKYVEELKAKCAATAKLHNEAKKHFDAVYAAGLAKITALSNSNA